MMNRSTHGQVLGGLCESIAGEESAAEVIRVHAGEVLGAPALGETCRDALHIGVDESLSWRRGTRHAREEEKEQESQRTTAPLSTSF